MLLLSTTEDLEMYADLAADQHVDTKLVKQIKEGSMLPFFGSFTNFVKSNSNDCYTNVYPAKRIKGKQDYYYAIINDYLMPYKTLSDKTIFNFNQYTHELWPVAV